MKKLNETLYEIATGLYADRRSDGQWYVTDEQEEILDGPFASIEAVAASRVEAQLDALDPETVTMLKPGDPGWVEFKFDQPVTIPPGLHEVTNTTGEPIPVVTPEQAADLVTLREAAEFLPITRQGLEYRRKKGILGVDPVVTGRSTELYSLKALKAVYPS